MNTYLKKINHYINKTIYKFKELSLLKKVLVIAVAGLVVSLIISKIFSNKKVDESIGLISHSVKIATVSDLSSNTTPLPLLGNVTSQSEAVIRAESSGQLTSVYKKLGDYVSAGDIIAEFSNQSEKAQVTQAEGSYQSAKANRDTSLDQSKVQALNTINSTYTTLDDVIHTKIDVMFKDQRTDHVTLLPLVPDAGLTYKIQKERMDIEALLISREKENRNITINYDLLTELTTVETETKLIRTFLDDLSNALSKTVPTPDFSQTLIDSNKITISTTRTTVNTALSLITSSLNALNVSLVTNKEVNETTSAEAQVKVALGSLQLAKAHLENTIIRSPLSGTLNSLSIQTGDFITQNSQVGVVSNNWALEIIAYVNDDDIKQIAVGNKVSVVGGAVGVVTKIAQAIDPMNKKIEVRIGITEGKNLLINGQSVQIFVSRNQTKNLLIKNDKIQIPISALKITPQGSFVFSLDKDNVLIAHKVKEGVILGDQIQILEGVTNDMLIVTDARGLKEGQKVGVIK